MNDSYLSAILARFRELREAKKVSPEQIEERLILGPGWVVRFEAGQSVPSLDMLFAMLNCIGASMDDLLRDLQVGEAPSEISRFIHAVPKSNGLNIHFQYADHDAIYNLERATPDEFESVLKVLRDGLAQHTHEGRGGKLSKRKLSLPHIWKLCDFGRMRILLIFGISLFIEPFVIHLTIRQSSRG